MCSISRIIVFHFQVIEYDTPEKLLENEASAFSKMVQSTGPANAEYLRGLVASKDKESRSRRMEQISGEPRWLVSSRWNAAVQHALAASLTSSVRDLQVLNFEENNVISKTKDAVVLLQDVMLGKHDKDIEETLDQFEVPRYTWWSAFYRVIEGVLTVEISHDPQHSKFCLGEECNDISSR